MTVIHLPFGKNKDVDIEDVSTDYLKWIVEKADQPWNTTREAWKDFCSEIEDELASREKHGGNF